MYNIVNVSRNYQGLINLEKLIVYKNNIENNDIENRKVDIKEVKKTIINA